MSSEGVAFLVVLTAVGAIPGLAALLAYRQTAKRTDARLSEILLLLRGRSARRAIGYEFPPRSDPPPRAS